MSKQRNEREQRLAKANELLTIIASCGRDFFDHNGIISQLALDERERVWFVDSYSGKRVYTHSTSGRWRGFTNGGTMRSLVVQLQKYVLHGKLIWAGTFGPWSHTTCGGDLWGYGPDMQKVRDAAARLEMMGAPAKEDSDAKAA